VALFGAISIACAALATTPAAIPATLDPDVAARAASTPVFIPGDLPDPVKTPGAVRTTDRAEICNTKTKDVRDVSGSLKEAVRRSYGMSHKRDGWCNGEEACEIDHLIPLAIGGSNDQTNLWPQPYDRERRWNAHMKDRLEVRLRKLICKQGLDPVEAQTLVAKDWTAAYQKWVGPSDNVADGETAN
jgi:hypothetical protein